MKFAYEFFGFAAFTGVLLYWPWIVKAIATATN